MSGWVGGFFLYVCATYKEDEKNNIKKLANLSSILQTLLAKMLVCLWGKKRRRGDDVLEK